MLSDLKALTDWVKLDRFDEVTIILPINKLKSTNKLLRKKWANIYVFVILMFYYRKRRSIATINEL